MMATELQIDRTFTGSNGTLVTIYECEHLTSKTYRLENGPNLVSTGENTCVLLCAHCMTSLTGLVMGHLVRKTLIDQTNDELQRFIDGARGTVSSVAHEVVERRESANG
jgi:uncharacterized protein YuzB (UPF0349 family)